MPFPTTTALPLLSGDMHARARAHTHTHTQRHTPQVKGHLSAPSVPHEEEPSIRQHFEKAKGSLGRAFPLSPRSATAKQTPPTETPEKEG